MAQLFKPQFVLLFKVGCGLALFFVTAAIIVGRASVDTDAPIDSPITQVPPFSHKHHVSDVGLDCRFCHASVETSAFAGIPPTSTCMNCHSQIFSNQAIMAPVLASYRTDRPIRWKRVHHLPEFAYFNHGIHIAKGVGCSSCHGHVEQMALLWRTATLDMNWCIDCHRAPERYLRPRDRVFDMDWQPPADQFAQGTRLLAAYHIDKRRLLDCSNCHR